MLRIRLTGVVAVQRGLILAALRGIRAALAEDGLQLAAQYTYDFTTPYLMDSDLLPRLRQDAGRVWDALIFSSPWDAVLLLKNQLQAAGIRVGPDIALACFDENPMTRYNGITVMRQPNADITRGAVFLLDSLMAGRLRPTGGMRLQYRAELLARESTEG